MCLIQRLLFSASLLVMVGLCRAAPLPAFVGEAHKAWDVDRLPGVERLEQPAKPGQAPRTNQVGALNLEQRTWMITGGGTDTTPHRLWGPGLRLDILPSSDAEDVEQTCRLFLSRLPWTEAIVDDLELLGATRRNRRWYLTFAQNVAGLPVLDSRVDLRLHENGEVFALGFDVVTGADIRGRVRLPTSAALLSALPEHRSKATDVQARLVLVPASSHRDVLIRAYELQFRTVEPLGNWYCIVDAETGELLRRQNRIRYADVTGRMTADVEPATVGDPTLALPLRETRVNIGNGLVEFGFSDDNGDFAVQTAAVDSVDVFLRLAGRFARVFNDADGRTTPRIDAKVLPGAPRDFHWDASNSKTSERDAYYHTLFAHRALKLLDPAFTGTDYVMPVVVDITAANCNAFYDGFGINFLIEGSGCANTARIADVVYHEYGHAITDQQYRPLAPSGAMHEAFSDYFAATLTDQPLVGRGFRGPDTWLRNLDNSNTYPDDLNGEFHHDGLILGGALWDLRQALGAALADSLAHFARYGFADTFNDYLIDVLFSDDDNGSIYDGTPHFDEIVAAFMSHGIGDYNVRILHEPLADSENLDKPLIVEAQFLSLFQLDPQSLQLHYRIDGGDWQVLPMNPTGEGERRFAATLPGEMSERNLEYYLSGSDVAQHAASLPGTAPDEVFAFSLGQDTEAPTIVFHALEDRPIDSDTWPVGASVTDNLDLDVASVKLLWSRNTPALDQEISMSRTQGDEWLAALSAANANLGDQFFYALVATDSAATPNQSRLPATGELSFTVVRGYFRDFEATDGGITGTGDWQWGTPAVGPAAAFSGVQLWGTRLDSGYFNDQTSDLELPAVNLSGWSRAALSFRSWVAAEDFYDGGRVEISTNGGSSWNAIVPNHGYPSAFLDVFGGPGYSGESEGWEVAEFDLSQYLGQDVRLRLRFLTDGSVTDLGWYIDDLEVVERQILSVPLELNAQSGEDQRVSLHWQPPAGIDPASPSTPLLGYDIYRGNQPDLSDAVKLNAMPLGDESFVDQTVTNGVTYFYAVTGLYASGESPRSTAASALPFRAVLASDIDRLDVQSAVVALDTSIVFSNAGTGTLALDFWLGTDTDDIDDVRIAFDTGQLAIAAASEPGRTHGVAAPSTLVRGHEALRRHGIAGGRSEVHSASSSRDKTERGHRHKKKTATRRSLSPKVVIASGVPYETLFTDTDDTALVPDIAAISAKVEGDMLFFKIQGHSNWGNILEDFTFIISLDADADLGSGDPAGNEFFVLMGGFPMQQIGSPAFVSDLAQQIVGIPGHQVFPNAADSCEVGFGLDLIGSPERIYLSLLALDNSLMTLRDQAPNPSPVQTWLQLGLRGLSVSTGQPQPLPLAFSNNVAPGSYAGKIFLESNDPDASVRAIPVTYVFHETPVRLSDFQLQQVRNDVRVTWRTHDEVEVASFRLFRGEPGRPLRALEPDVAATGEGFYEFRDPGVEPGTYVYRIAEVNHRSELQLLAAENIHVIRQIPQRTFLDANFPNPFNPSTHLRFGLQERVPVSLTLFDARGRLVRRLLQREVLGAGYHQVLWDGRDETGRRVASGIYHARLVAAGRRLHRSLTLIK